MTKAAAKHQGRGNALGLVGAQPGGMSDGRPFEHEAARRYGQPDIGLVLGSPETLADCGHVDDLHVSSGLRRNGACVLRNNRVAGQGLRPKARRCARAQQRRSGLGLGGAQRGVHAAKFAQVVDPAQHRQDHQHDHHPRHRHKRHRRAAGVQPGLQNDDRAQRIDERADEGRQHGLRRAVIQQDPVRARRRLRRRRPMRRHHHVQRKGTDRKHARRKDRQHRQNGVRAQTIA